MTGWLFLGPGLHIFISMSLVFSALHFMKRHLTPGCTFITYIYIYIYIKGACGTWKLTIAPAMARQMGGPLHDAAFLGKLEDVEVLLGQDANVNEQTATGLTPLHLASARGHDAVVKLLINKGANVDAKTGRVDVGLYTNRPVIATRKLPPDGGYTSLHLAVLCGNKKIIEMLVDNGADINARTENGNSSLHLVLQTL